MYNCFIINTLFILRLDLIRLGEKVKFRRVRINVALRCCRCPRLFLYPNFRKKIRGI
jgi:hypothetical protein